MSRALEHTGPEFDIMVSEHGYLPDVWELSATLVGATSRIPWELSATPVGLPLESRIPRLVLS